MPNPNEVFRNILQRLETLEKKVAELKENNNAQTETRPPAKSKTRTKK